MSDTCPHYRKCLLFMDRLSQVPRFPTLFKMQFCLGHFHACARYLVAQKSGPENVPRDLLPVDMDQVLSLQGR